MKLSELAPEVRARVLDKHRYDELQAYEWWGYTYEDAKNLGRILGIDIETISFDECSAGINGEYSHNPKAAEQIVNEAPVDAELLRLANELAMLNMECFLTHGSTISATIRATNRGFIIDAWIGNDTDDVNLALEGPRTKDFDKVMTDFARWIHKQLMSEEEYLSSDEAVSERLADEDFDEDGGII